MILFSVQFYNKLTTSVM